MYPIYIFSGGGVYVCHLGEADEEVRLRRIPDVVGDRSVRDGLGSIL
jgi:hypothetical protein